MHHAQLRHQDLLLVERLAFGALGLQAGGRESDALPVHEPGGRGGGAMKGQRVEPDAERQPRKPSRTERHQKVPRQSSVKHLMMVFDIT